MNEMVVVKKVLVPILEKIAPELAKASPMIIDAIKTYGCRNQVAITQMVASAFPTFINYSEIVLSKLNEAISIVAKSETQNYDLVIQAVLNDNLATLEEKTSYVLMINKSEIELENNRANNFTKKAATVGAAGIAFIGIGSGAAVSIINALAKGAVKVANAQNEGKFLYQVVKLLRGIR